MTNLSLDLQPVLQVLLVEDSEDDAFLIRREFARVGFEAFFERVETAPALIDALDRQRWDVVISDFSMPKFSGLAALAIVKERGLEIPFLMVTGTVSEETVIAAMQAGASDYVMKDNPRKLVAAVQRELRRQPSAQPLTARAQSGCCGEFELGVAFVVVDSEERLVSFNSVAQKLFGLDDKSEKQPTLRGLLPDDPGHTRPHVESLYHACTNASEGGLPVYRALAADSREFMAELTVTRNENFKARRYSIVIRDVTEWTRLRAESSRYQSTLHAFAAGAEKLTYDLDEHGLGKEIVQTCVADFGARRAWIALAEPDGRMRTIAAMPVHDFPAGTIRWDRAFGHDAGLGRAVRSGAPVILDDDVGRGLLTTGAFPLISRERPFGVMVLESDDRGFFEVGAIQVIQTFAHQAAAALDNARLRKEAEKRLERMAALRAVEMAISSSMDLNLTFSVVLDTVLSHLHCDAACLLLLNRHTQELEFADEHGFNTSAVRCTNVRVGESYAGRAALERRAVVVTDFAENMGSMRANGLMTSEGFQHYVAVPIIGKGRVIGVMEIFHRTRFEAKPDWLDFANAMATQIAIAIDSYHMFTELQKVNANLVIAYNDTIEGWARALELKDGETEGHSRRVTELTMRLARELDVPQDACVHIRRGALLHDIGKMGIPDSILLKPGPLTPEEREVIKRHPGHAHDMLAPIPYLREAMEIPYCHHEKWDGTGYPRGLKREQIPLSARLFAVVDVYDALSSDRPYRKAWSEDQVVEHLRKLSGSHFDPRIVEVFLNMNRCT